MAARTSSPNTSEPSGMSLPANAPRSDVRLYIHLFLESFPRQKRLKELESLFKHIARDLGDFESDANWTEIQESVAEEQDTRPFAMEPDSHRCGPYVSEGNSDPENSEDHSEQMSEDNIGDENIADVDGSNSRKTRSAPGAEAAVESVPVTITHESTRAASMRSTKVSVEKNRVSTTGAATVHGPTSQTLRAPQPNHQPSNKGKTPIYNSKKTTALPSSQVSQFRPQTTTKRKVPVYTSAVVTSPSSVQAPQPETIDTRPQKKTKAPTQTSAEVVSRPAGRPEEPTVLNVRPECLIQDKELWEQVRSKKGSNEKRTVKDNPAQIFQEQFDNFASKVFCEKALWRLKDALKNVPLQSTSNSIAETASVQSIEFSERSIDTGDIPSLTSGDTAVDELYDSLCRNYRTDCTASTKSATLNIRRFNVMIKYHEVIEALKSKKEENQSLKPRLEKFLGRPPSPGVGFTTLVLEYVLKRVRGSTMKAEAHENYRREFTDSISDGRRLAILKFHFGEGILALHPTSLRNLRIGSLDSLRIFIQSVAYVIPQIRKACEVAQCAINGWKHPMAIDLLPFQRKISEIASKGYYSETDLGADSSAMDSQIESESESETVDNQLGSSHKSQTAQFVTNKDQEEDVAGNLIRNVDCSTREGSLL